MFSSCVSRRGESAARWSADDATLISPGHKQDMFLSLKFIATVGVESDLKLLRTEIFLGGENYIQNYQFVIASLKSVVESPLLSIS